MEMRPLDPAGVWIAELPPCPVAAASGFGPGPETLAWNALFAWMKAAGIPVRKGRFFGFNNPNPTPGNANYGYEQWLLLDDEEKRAAGAGPGVEIKSFPGGRFAVCRHRGSPEALPATWSSLRAWVESSGWRCTDRQWMEECLTPGLLLKKLGPPRWEDFVFDVYMAVDR